MYLSGENFSSRAFGSPVVFLQKADGIIIAEAQPEGKQTEPRVPSQPAIALVQCPNRSCSGKVLSSDKKCATCRHELTKCPNCGCVMSKTLGICVDCGYEEESRLVYREAGAVKKEAEPLQVAGIETQRTKT